jgi:para-aminobenzoate synthetase/4-amino-4-deoxychorismate lyase
VPKDAGQQRDWGSIAANEPGSILLQSAPSRVRSGRSMLFREPENILEARQPSDVPQALAAIEEMLARGFYLAGYVAYEAGFALEPSLADLASTLPDEEPLLWLGCYRAPEVREDAFLCDPRVAPASPLHLAYSLTSEAYEQQVRTVRDLIAAGETYQANLTIEAEWDAAESAAELYERLLRAQPVPYAALLHPQPDWHILSLSPELFFNREGDRIQTRPMKGTASPGMDATESQAQAEWLRASEKNRAENVMIVDLLRNDLGRICETGSVEVTKLFEVERYPTVLQMTSTVEGRLRKHIRYRDVFGALFPSGSIVGAPKIHTMRLLQGLENRQRGVYTGAIGYIAPQAQAEFNVAIRTVSLRKGRARLGVGAGITFDSDPALEYAECLTKTTFLERELEPEFELIETLLLEEGKFAFVEEHMERLAQSAEYFHFGFDAMRVRTALQDAAQSWPAGERVRVRLLLNRAGSVTCTASRLQRDDGVPVDLLLRGERVSPDDRFLRHKTTHRALYDRAWREAQAQGFADCMFRNTRGEITEGAIHNVVASLAGEWCTPPLQCGVLPGIYRRHLLQQGKVRERVLTLGDLLRAEAIFICNSVRGMRPVRRIVEPGAIGARFETVWTGSQTGA